MLVLTATACETTQARKAARSRVLRALDGADAKDEIEAALGRASELVHATGARSYEPQVLLERARLAEVLADEAGHQRWLREAHSLFADELFERLADA